jgi:hypothetical protein
VLGHIEAGGLLPPLVVLQALAANPALKLAVVAGYMGRALGAEAAAADEDRAAVARFQAETAGMRAEVAELRTQARGRARAPSLPHVAQGLLHAPVPGVAAPGVAVTYLAVPALAACAPGAPRRPGPRCGRRGAPCYCPHAPCMWAAQAAGAACAGTTAAQAQVCGACRVRACCSDRALWCGRRRGGRGRRGPRRPQAPARPGRRLAATTRPAGPRARAARRHACSRTAAAR